MNNFDNTVKLSHWMIELIGKNKDTAITEHGADWEWVAAEVWNRYTGIFNEFTINDAIDFLCEAAEFRD
jgi:hypothetical protein